MYNRIQKLESVDLSTTRTVSILIECWMHGRQVDTLQYRSAQKKNLQPFDQLKQDIEKGTTSYILVFSQSNHQPPILRHPENELLGIEHNTSQRTEYNKGYAVANQV